MLGTNTESYRLWRREWNRYKNMPKNLDYVNLGSTCDFNNYDYKYWDGKGFNFASAPQDMYYDSQLLKQYGDHLKKGAYVFINISEFAFLTDKYESDYHNHKYYWYVDPARILNYSEAKARLLKFAPGLVDNRYIKQEIKDLLKSIVGSIRKSKPGTEPLEAMSRRLVSSWIKEFCWQESVKLRNEQFNTIDHSWNIFLEDIEYCKIHELTPIIVIPPFNQHLKEMLPSNILDGCLWKYTEKMKELGLKVIDFWNSDILSDDRYYRTPITLNEDGKRLFNMTLQSEILGNNVIDTLERLSDDFDLNTGVQLPPIAFGTGVIKRFYRNKPMYFRDTMKAILVSIKHRKMVRFFKNDLTIRKTLDAAFESGYRLYDTGRLYGHSEKYIGKTLCKDKREDYYLITKVSDVDLERYPNSKTVHDNLSLSLKWLKTGYVDAYLLHFPSGDWSNMYKEMEKEYESGSAKAIGVCNFDIEEMKKLISIATVQPMICQIEIHPLNNKRELVNFCHDHRIVVMAHTPTGHMSKDIIETKEFKDIMIKHNKSAAQVIYRWHHQNGVIPIVSSTSKAHLKSNLEIFDFELSEDEMKFIDSLNKGYSFDRNNNKINDCPAFIYNL